MSGYDVYEFPSWFRFIQEFDEVGGRALYAKDYSRSVGVAQTGAHKSVSLLLVSSSLFFSSLSSLSFFIFAYLVLSERAWLRLLLLNR